MKINNRRYTGSKYKLMGWIKEKMILDCKDCKSFFDIFAGTGVVTSECIDLYDEFILNDFLYSNNIIFKAFFNKGRYSNNKLNEIKKYYQSLDSNKLKDNYISRNYGNKYFSYNDAKLIGYIRNDIEIKLKKKIINRKEYYILLTSLIYSFDKISNTVGHYEAYIKGKNIKDLFIFDLIEPIKTNKKIKIYRCDANKIANRIQSDIVFIDPPYSSRQYSRFYHVLETIVKNDEPELFGVAMKPKEENMSDYCRNSAPIVFNDLINKLNCRYIVVTYNNTYNSKSSSSENKISLDQIKSILDKRGKTKIYEHEYNAFNAGKTDIEDHKEYLFITEVTNE